MRFWKHKKMTESISKLPKRARFWRLTTLRKTHYDFVPHFGDPPMSVQMPLKLWRKAWLARLLNEDVLLEVWGDFPKGHWQQIFYWPARRLQKPLS